MRENHRRLFWNFFEQNKHVKTSAIPPEEMEEAPDVTWLEFLRKDEDKLQNQKEKGNKAKQPPQEIDAPATERSSRSTETSLLSFLLELKQDGMEENKSQLLQFLAGTDEPEFAKSEEETQSLIDLFQQPREEPDQTAVVETLHLILTPRKK